MREVLLQNRKKICDELFLFLLKVSTGIPGSYYPNKGALGAMPENRIQDKKKSIHIFVGDNTVSSLVPVIHYYFVHSLLEQEPVHAINFLVAEEGDLYNR